MFSRTAKSIVAATIVATGLLTAGPALADTSGTLPSGCTISPSTPTIFTVNGQKQVTYGGSAFCRAASSADFRLVHNNDNFPDILVKQTNIPKSDGNFYYSSSTCDNGGTTQYYSEIHLYVSGSPQKASKTVTLTHC